MALGRCAGCGKTGSACKIKDHCVQCPPWLALFQEDPRRALDPGAEYIRWRDEDKNTERVTRREQVVVTTDASRAASLARFAVPPDILAD
jgi:hypothetical protein